TTACAVAAATVGALALGSSATAAPGGHHGPPGHGHDDGIVLEDLDRGLVAASTSEGVFLSWRLLRDEGTGATDSGMAGTGFAVYRDGRQVGTVTDSTNYVDPDGEATSRYVVAPLRDGRKGKGKGKGHGKSHVRWGERSETVVPLAGDHLDI